MIARHAAKMIGITHAQVLMLCRKGKLKARKCPLNNGDPNAFAYDIPEREVIRYRDNRPRRGPKSRSSK